MSYIAKHTPEEYLEFEKQNDCTFETIQNELYPRGVAPNHSLGAKVKMFSIKSQWVDGETIEECLDKAIDYVPRRYKTPECFNRLLMESFNEAIDSYIKKRGITKSGEMKI